MILTVTPNPALDVTYRVPALTPGAVHRVTEVAVRAGGKGINVARVLHRLGARAAVLGLGGGDGGHRIRAELIAADLDVELIDALPDVRRTLVVHGGDGVTTSLWEPGPAPVDPAAAADALLTAVRDRLDAVRVVTVSGSLPAGLDPALPARISAACAEHGTPAVLDLDGAPLRSAAATVGAVLMPNTEELAALTGRHPADAADAAGLARELVGPGGASAVVATLGAGGLVVVTPTAAVHARPPRVTGNPTGAGDAACAAVARYLAAAGPLPASPTALGPVRELATHAAALSAASVLRPVAGEVDPAAYLRWLPHIALEEL
ncbi:MAG TPA: hexose kinase [Pseudonocardia sp.]|nr:hexose kinase [Pseudonocardia sp.]